MQDIPHNPHYSVGKKSQKKLCILAIGSLPKSAYKDGATLEGNKHSGNIEYSVDFGFGIQFQGFDSPNFNFNEAKKANPRNVEIVVLKQRLAAGGEAIPFTYFPAYNAFVSNSDLSNSNMTIGVISTDNASSYSLNMVVPTAEIDNSNSSSRIDDEDEGFDPLIVNMPCPFLG